MAAHRYWRLTVYADFGDALLDVGDVAFATSVGGPNVATNGGAATASSTYNNSACVPAYAFDDNMNTRWMTDGSAFPQWVAYDFGSGGEVEIVETRVTVIPWVDGTTQRQPASFSTDWSDDGATWTAGATDTASGWILGETRAYPPWPPGLFVPASHRYWRFLVLSTVAGATVQIGDIALAGSAGGANLCVGGTATASTNSANAAWAFDGIDTTCWASDGSALPQWVCYDFGASVAVAEMRYAAFIGPPAGSEPLVIRLEGSDDNNAWNPAWIGDVAANTTPTTDSGGHRYWRLLDPTSDSYIPIAEVQFHRSVGGPAVYGLPSADTSYNSSPGNAIDGNAATFWQANGDGPHWFMQDFGPNQYAFAEVAITATSSSEIKRQWTALEIQWSDDNSTWTTAGDYTGLSQTSGTTYTYAITQPVTDPGGHRYWRLLDPLSTDSYLPFAEVAFHRSVGGPAVYGLPSADTSYNSSPGNAIDGNPATFWQANVDGPHWFMQDFAPNKYAFAEVEITAMPAGNTPRPFSELQIQWSDDGAAWTTAGDYTGLAQTAGATYTYAASGAAAAQNANARAYATVF